MNEQVFRDGGELFSGLLQAMDDVVVWAATADGSQMLYINDAAERVYGRPASEFYRNPHIWVQVIHSEDQEKAQASARQLTEMGEASVRVRIVRPDGEVRWIDDRKHLIRDDEGRPLRIGGIATDITDQVMLQRQIRNTVALIERVTEASPVGVIVYSGAGQCVFVNPAAAQTVGASQEQLLQENFHRIDSWKQSGLLELAKQTLSTGVDNRSTVYMTTSYGRSVWLDIRLIALPSEDEVQLLLIVDDITRRVQNEDALRQARDELEQRVQERTSELADINRRLRESQAQLQAILDHSPALISIKDLTGKMLLVNRKFEVLDGPAPQDYLGRSVFELFPQEVAETLWQNDLAALEAGGPVEFEEVVAHRDGELHTYLTVKFPLYQDDGNPFGVCAVSTDISGRKLAEEEVRRSLAELQRFNRLAVGRELRMIELKREVNELARELARPAPYDLSFAEGE